MIRPPLSPLGTARLAISREAPRDLSPFPPDLAALARAADLGDERLHLAWELVRLLRGVSEDVSRGWLVLFLLLFDAIARGSTRLALDPADRGPLRLRAQALGIARADMRLAESCVKQMLASVSHDAKGTEGQLEIHFDAPSERVPYAPLVGTPEMYRPLILDGKDLVPQRLFALEKRLAQILLARSPGRHDNLAIERALESVLRAPASTSRGPIALTNEQAAAVRAAIRGPVAVISGGPGTGKTSIVVSILRVLARLETPEVVATSVAMAAPTGKAADRLTQSIRRALDGLNDPVDRALRETISEARTLHRWLAYSPSEERFLHDEDNPLASKMMIVDEASMVDLALMERLVSALEPGARVVLLGDADQLPSVEPGAVLADLVSQDQRSAITITRLTESHRMDPRDRAGSHILKIAAAIREGKAPPFSEGELTPGVVRRVSSPRDVAEGVSSLMLRDESAREAWLSWWYEHRVRGSDELRRLMERGFVLTSNEDALFQLFSWLESSRLLCVTRGRSTGADAINAWMGARFRQERKMGSGSLLLVGEPVMVVRNEYERGLFNGDQGLVLWVREDPSASARPALVVRRGEHFVSHRIESVHLLLERAYASTVHKAQGSEHDDVALLLPDEDVPRLLTREIVYTAITRARRSVLLVGSPLLLEKAIARPAARTTGLARWLLADVMDRSSLA